MNYRNWIYAKYAELSSQEPHLETQWIERQGSVFGWNLRGWLPLQLNAAIVDVGCGKGALLGFLIGSGYTNVAGVDSSESQITVAQKYCKNVQCKNVTEFLSAADKKYDFIFATDLIEHFSKDELIEFLTVCRTALRVDGSLIIQTVNAFSPRFATYRYGDLTHEISLTPTILSDVLAFSGFTQSEFRECSPPLYGYSAASTMRALVWPLVKLPVKLFDLVETGGMERKIYSRNMMVKAR